MACQMNSFYLPIEQDISSLHIYFYSFVGTQYIILKLEVKGRNKVPAFL